MSLLGTDHKNWTGVCHSLFLIRSVSERNQNKDDVDWSPLDRAELKSVNPCAGIWP